MIPLLKETSGLEVTETMNKSATLGGGVSKVRDRARQGASKSSKRGNSSKIGKARESEASCFKKDTCGPRGIRGSARQPKRNSGKWGRIERDKLLTPGGYDWGKKENYEIQLTKSGNTKRWRSEMETRAQRRSGSGRARESRPSCNHKPYHGR